MSDLYKKLVKYGESGDYPFHMPGHKRKVADSENPYLYDITEIDGFDNLHHPEGIIRKAMDQAKEIFGSDESYFLVNGSTCGILAAINAVTNHGDKVIVARNCHRSVYNALYVNELKAVYIQPDVVEQYGINGGISSFKIERALENNEDAKAIIITSPTYEGIVSDIEKIAEIAHSRDIPLIVDEAHGAHFGHHLAFPKSALELGADIVIQSLHKTLPALTQTAIMHVKGSRVEKNKLESAIDIYETSSPSYVLLASIDECMNTMKENGAALFEQQIRLIDKFKEYASSLNYIKVMGTEIVGRNNVFDLDISKLVISTRGTNLTGKYVYDYLRTKSHVQLEMASIDYCIAMTSPLDSQDGIMSLFRGLVELDSQASRESLSKKNIYEIQNIDNRVSIYEAMSSAKQKVSIKNTLGSVSSEYVMAYPPGIPIIAPGEIITANHLELIERYKEAGITVIGPEDESIQYLNVMVNPKEGLGEKSLSHKIFCIMGKSATGKDTIYNMLVKDGDLNLKKVTSYTTRPKRNGEEEGVQYHFTDEEGLAALEASGKVVEKREYKTVQGNWCYFTVDDGSIDLSENNYVLIGTPDSYRSLCDYFGKEVIVPIYVTVEDSERILRALARERQQISPDYAEMCRRYLADNDDFKPDVLRRLGVKKYYDNHNLKECYEEIRRDIKKRSV